MIDLMEMYGTQDVHELFARHAPIEISQSSASMALNCTQMYALKYIYRLRLRGINWATTTGKAIHRGFETLLTNASLDDALEVVHTFFDDIGEQADLLGPSDLPKAETARAQAVSIIKGWFIIQGVEFKGSTKEKKKRTPLGDTRTKKKKNATPLGKVVVDNRFEIQSVEHRVRGVRTRVEWNTVRHKLGDDAYIARMCGMIDAIVGILDPKETVKLAIMDHKSKHTLMYHDAASLELNFQIAWYIVMAISKWPDLNGLLYNVVMKPQHKGDYETAEAKMSKAILEDQNKYQQLDLIPLSKEQIDGFRENIRRAIAFVDSITPDNVTMNTTRCDDYGGCEFRPLCNSGCRSYDPHSVATNLSIGLYRVGTIHEELEQE